MQRGAESLKLLAELSGDFTPHAQAVPAAAGVQGILNYISMPTAEDVRAGRYGRPVPSDIIETEQLNE